MPYRDKLLHLERLVKDHRRRAHHGRIGHHVEPEVTVAVEQYHLLVGVGEFRGYGEVINSAVYFPERTM